MLTVRRIAFVALTALAVGCRAGDSRNADSTAGTTRGVRVDLTGAGATFPYPLYARWFNEYAQRTNVRINYQSIGSGAGIRQLAAHTVDFGATDVPMSDSDIASAGGQVLHVPTAVGAVALTYNLPDLARPLNLSGEVIADIFLGRITKWNDARLLALNPRVNLPNTDILVVHRADGSGTSYIVSDYLSAVSPTWATGPGRGRDVEWPVGLGGRGNEGVAGQVKQMPGAIGYLEVVYARQNRLPVAHIQNRDGRFVSPLPFEIASAAAVVLDSTKSADLTDLRVSLVNSPGAQSYPIASFTWMLIAPRAIGPAKTAQLVSFLRWALLDGSDLASSLGYVPLPTTAATRVIDRLEALTAPASR